MKQSFDSIIIMIHENRSNGYETAIVSDKNKKAVKYGSLIQEESELPDVVKNCSLLIWNNDNIDSLLSGYQLI